MQWAGETTKQELRDRAILRPLKFFFYFIVKIGPWPWPDVRRHILLSLVESFNALQ